MSSFADQQRHAHRFPHYCHQSAHHRHRVELSAQSGRGSPFVTSTDGTNNVIVWVVGSEGDQRLHGYNGDTGAVVYAGGGANELMAGTRSFNTGIAARGRIYVATDNKVYAFTVPATSTQTTASSPGLVATVSLPAATIDTSVTNFTQPVVTSAIKMTKRFAEDLTDFLLDRGVKTKYLHSDIDTLERVAIVRDLRLGKFDVLVGVNLLREGLDLPEVSLVAILDADKEGFLRSETSLIQTCGRASRNLNGKVAHVRRPCNGINAQGHTRDREKAGGTVGI